MHLTALFVAETQSISLAANSKIQAINFAICFGIGVLSGIFALLYFRRSNRAEMFITDLFATLCIGGFYIFLLEYFFDGKFEPYALIAFLLGTAILPLIFKSIKKLHFKKTKT